MSGQRFYASADCFTWPNGAKGYRPGGAFDCLGPFAKVKNCPIRGRPMVRTVYATGYANTYFSIPAHCDIAGRTVKGFLALADSGPEFVPYTNKENFNGLHNHPEKVKALPKLRV